MFPEDYERQLAELRAQQAAGGLGLTGAERTQIESGLAARQAGQTADLQAQQLQQAQSMAGGGAVNSAMLFQQQVAAEEAQRRQAALDEQIVMQEQARVKAAQEQRLDELVAAEAEARIAERQAKANLAADLLSAGAQTGVGIAGTQAMGQASQALLQAQGAQGRQAAMSQMYNTQMAMSMAGAFGGGQMPAMPMPVMPAPATGTTLQATGGQGPATGFMQMPDGSLVPIYGATV
jgi:hypothetical protein